MAHQKTLKVFLLCLVSLLLFSHCNRRRHITNEGRLTGGEAIYQFNNTVLPPPEDYRKFSANLYHFTIIPFGGEEYGNDLGAAFVPSNMELDILNFPFTELPTILSVLDKDGEAMPKKLVLDKCKKSMRELKASNTEIKISRPTFPQKMLDELHKKMKILNLEKYKIREMNYKTLTSYFTADSRTILLKLDRSTLSRKVSDLTLSNIESGPVPWATICDVVEGKYHYYSKWVTTLRSTATSKLNYVLE